MRKQLLGAIGGLLIGIAVLLPAETASQVATILFGTSSGTAVPVTVNASGHVAVAIQGGTPPAYDAGTGTQDFAACGLITFSATTADLAANTDEQTLWTFSLPANTLVDNGDLLKLVVKWNVASNGNTKTGRVKFGGTTVQTHATTSSGVMANTLTYVVKDATTTVRLFGLMDVGSTGVQLAANGVSGLDFTGAIVISFTGQSNIGTAADVSFRLATVEYCKTSP